MRTSLRDAAATFVGVPARAQTYRNLVYLGLAVTLAGVPILLATLAGATLLARFEAELANRLLGRKSERGRRTPPTVSSER